VRTLYGCIAVPVIIGGAITSLQFISADGGKRLLKGGAVAGGAFEITGDDTVVICEGFATGASIREATGYSVIVAFNSDNLVAAAFGGPAIEVKVRSAAQVIEGTVNTASQGTMLLDDIRDLFDARDTDQLKSQAIVTALAELEGRPWAEYRKGKPITVARGRRNTCRRTGCGGMRAPTATLSTAVAQSTKGIRVLSLRGTAVCR
jgi:hypothetical protein